MCTSSKILFANCIYLFIYLFIIICFVIMGHLDVLCCQWFNKTKYEPTTHVHVCKETAENGK